LLAQARFNKTAILQETPGLCAMQAPGVLLSVVDAVDPILITVFRYGCRTAFEMHCFI
jgi:hypothetical protein